MKARAPKNGFSKASNRLRINLSEKLERINSMGIAILGSVDFLALPEET